MNISDLLNRFEEEQVFLKTSAKMPMDSASKSLLNRRGNMLFNNGDIESAKRVFVTTGYSDGLSRVGDYYKSKGRMIDALQMYWIAPDKKKSTEMIMEVSLLIQSLLHEKGGGYG
ncbi:hypothetical protein FACS189494_07740 [Spirochaetia bacterium]|nr:hypothetical protein FACS189494_07740 [Spirochaetia bacterium]